MKKLITLITAFALIVTLSGCSAGAPAAETNAADTAAPVTAGISSELTSAEPPVTVSFDSADTTSAAGESTADKKSGLRYKQGNGTLADEPNKAVRRKANTVKQIVGTMYNGEAVNSNFYYYRCTLSDNNKTAYDIIHAGLLTGAATITMSAPLSTSDVDTVYYSVIYDDPSIVWAEPGYDYTYNNNGYVISISPMYNSLVKDIPGTKKKLENSVSKALAVMWELPNNIERSKYAHDYLIHTIDYVENDLDQNAYSALVQHKTVCAGYSQAFAYMMQKMGAPCAVVIGYDGEDHAWNMVMLNGENYVTDVTWDDPYGNPPDTYYYDYFNITSSQMSRDHTLQSPSTKLPAAKGTYASYNNYFGGRAYGTDFNNPDIINPSATTTTPAEMTTKPSSTTKPAVTTTKPVVTTKPSTTTSYDWDSLLNDDWWNDEDWDNYWNDDWWNDNGIDVGTITSATTKPPVTTTKPPVTTTKPPVTTTKPSITTTKPAVTTTKPATTTSSASNPYNWDYYWDDDWDWGDDWDWYNSGDYSSWGIDLNDYDYDYDYSDYSDYFDDYSYYTGDSSSDGWWSYLDSYWKKSDWTNEGGGLWSIIDDETGYIYIYDESDGSFYCMDEDGSIYWYNSKKDDWELCS